MLQRRITNTIVYQKKNMGIADMRQADQGVN